MAPGPQQNGLPATALRSLPNTQPRTPPTWNPAALLNPRQLATSTAKPSPVSESVHAFGAHNHLEFRFAAPGDSSGNAASVEQNGVGTTNPGLAPSAGGLGNMIERMNNVEDRGATPASKRRKISPAKDQVGVKMGSTGTSSGVLTADWKANQNGSAGSTTLNPTPVDTVDLTSGDADADDDVVVIDKPQNIEVCYGMLQGAKVNCHRVPAPKPGMTAIGGPGWWPQVKIVLKRNDGERSSAIHVYDHTRAIFGTLDPKASSGLAPIMDSVQVPLRTDCRIPSRRVQPDEAVGRSISRAYKVELMLYGPLKFARHVGAFLARQGLLLVSPPRVQAGMRVFNPHANEPPAWSTSRASSSNATSYPHSALLTARTAEEVRSDVMGVFDSITKSEDLPEAEPDPRILTPLLRHQKQGLYFMMTKERPRVYDSDSKVAESFWQIRLDRHNQQKYYNVITGESQRQKPPETLGGILADMMGLGKTLSILSLVTGSMDEAEVWHEQSPTGPEKSRQKTDASNSFNVPVPASFDLTHPSKNSKATLLVCPLSTVANWEEQIKQHIKPGSLDVHIYHGQNRCRDIAKLSEYDLVITTYGSVTSELNARKKGQVGSFPLEEISWFRIVLDEAHTIREQSTLQFKAICRLQANRRWAVTGTPVQNRLDDLAALLMFIRLKPFDDKGKFVRHIVQPFKMCDPEIVPKLRVLVDSVTLRRLKDKIDLPPKVDDIVKLEFSGDERRLYEAFERNAKDRVKVLTSQSEKRILGGKTYITILHSILRLRLVCAHGKELLSEDDLELLKGMTQEAPIELDDEDDDKPALAESKAYEMLNLMKETNNDKCMACQRKLGANDAEDVEGERQEDILGYMSPCFHVFCSSRCVTSFRDEQHHIEYNGGRVGVCPYCLTEVKFSCFELRQTKADSEEDSKGKSKGSQTNKSLNGYGGPHTKTQHLVNELLQHKVASELEPDEPPIKSVVFSGWTTHLDLIQIALDNAGITYTRLDGKMSRIARTQAMDSFRDDPTVTVILVSIMAGGLGLNLTTGNNVFVMEPQFNPAAEAQAIDRVHRLGQKRPVRCIRYIMKNSFEEKMLILQDKKKKLANLSMDNRDKVGDKSEAARQRLADLKDLFK